jgi:AcrR family transcriptional regulator
MARRTKAVGTTGSPPALFHHGRLAEAAVDAAFKLVRSEGADRLTLRVVALACNVDHTALYRHFSNKSELLTAVVARGFELLLRRLEPNKARASFLAGYAQFALEEPRLYAAMFSAEMRPNYQRDPLAPHILALTRLAIECTRGKGRVLAISHGDRDSVLRDWALVHGLVDLWTRGLLRAKSTAEALTYIRRLLD